MIDAEPSRFLEEIDEKYIDNLTPVDNYRFKPLISSDIFGEVDKSRLRQQKPTNGTPPSPGRPSADQLRKLRKIRPNLGEPSVRTQEDIPELSVGTKVNHTRFGKGEVIKLEGAGNDKKAEIRFERGDVKKLLLRFAKLEVLN